MFNLPHEVLVNLAFIAIVATSFPMVTAVLCMFAGSFLAKKYKLSHDNSYILHFCLLAVSLLCLYFVLAPYLSNRMHKTFMENGVGVPGLLQEQNKQLNDLNERLQKLTQELRSRNN